MSRKISPNELDHHKALILEYMKRNENKVAFTVRDIFEYFYNVPKVEIYMDCLIPAANALKKKGVLFSTMRIDVLSAYHSCKAPEEGKA